MARHKFLAVPTTLLSLAALLMLVSFSSSAQTHDSLSSSAGVLVTSRSIWQQMPAPNPGGDALLFDFAADSGKDIWAVGDIFSLHFNGDVWSVVPIAFPGGQSSMNGVTVISSTDVWAVGTSQSGNHVASVIEHFDGQRWMIVPSPQFFTGSTLQKVHAFSANDIFAVGDFNSDNQQVKPLIEHYDGTKWSVMHTPALNNVKTATLFTIAGLSRSDFWIAGDSEGSTGIPVVLHFDGKNFTQVSFPETGIAIRGIAEITSNDAWIVGTGHDGFPLTVHWNGSAWSSVVGPKPGPSSGFNAVSAVSSTSVWASGNAGFANLVEHWNGKSWTISQIASPGDANLLSAAIAFPTGSVFVAGTTLHTTGFEPEIFHTTNGK